MNSTPIIFRAPTMIERLFNRTFGMIVRLGLGSSYRYLLEVRGRTTGRIFSTPVNLLEIDGVKYLVAPRGRAQWVRNAEAAGEIALKKGSTRKVFRLRALADPEKPRILKAYLDQFSREVQTFFPVAAGSPVAAFAEIAPNYPAFELQEK